MLDNPSVQVAAIKIGDRDLNVGEKCYSPGWGNVVYRVSIPRIYLIFRSKYTERQQPSRFRTEQTTASKLGAWRPHLFKILSSLGRW